MKKTIIVILILSGAIAAYAPESRGQSAIMSSVYAILAQNGFNGPSGQTETQTTMDSQKGPDISPGVSSDLHASFPGAGIGINATSPHSGISPGSALVPSSGIAPSSGIVPASGIPPDKDGSSGKMK